MSAVKFADAVDFENFVAAAFVVEAGDACAPPTVSAGNGSPESGKRFDGVPSTAFFLDEES